MKKQTKNSQNKIDQEILELAVSCKFISPQQEIEILPQLFQFSKDNVKNRAARFFLKENILSRDRIKLLFAIKQQVQTLMADKKFGRIGIANDFVSPKDVKKALDLQVAIFRKKKKSIKIGDILVNNKEMSRENQTAILLTQDRIKDELLAEALNTIAGSELERIAINKRFGAIAVKKEFISTAQLNQALKVQKKESKEKGKKRYLGEILKELFNISDADIFNILRIQKKFEVKRINLEKNLARFNSKKESNQTLDNYFDYYVSGDKLSAYVQYKTKVSQKIEVTSFLDWLSLSGIIFGLCSPKEIEPFLAKNRLSEQFKIAQGVAPVLPEKEIIELFFETKKDPKNIVKISTGDVLAKLTSGKKGQEGKDVFGRPVLLPDTEFETLTCGEGVVRKSDQFVATIDGSPVLFQNRTLFVTPVITEHLIKNIQGDITSDINEPDTILKVDGNVLSGISVFCYKLEIKGDILGNVTTETDIDVHGNIGQILEEKPGAIESATVEAKGGLFVAKNIMHSTIFGVKGIKAIRSELICSHATSFSDIVVKDIVSTKQVPSVLTIGRDEFFNIDKINQTIKKETEDLYKMVFKNELDQLSKELMDQVQIQNGYLEKQNVILFLSRILNGSQWEHEKDVVDKIKAFEAQKDKALDVNMDIVISKNTKAYEFMEVILKKVSEYELDGQKKYVNELYDNIIGIYKAAVKVTQRINKKYDARVKAINDQIEKIRPDIEQKEEKIEKLLAQKDYLKLNKKDKTVCPEAIIRVKNKISQHTIIRGEKAEMVVEKEIHGVCLKEERSKSKEGSTINIEGYFE